MMEIRHQKEHDKEKGESIIGRGNSKWEKNPDDWRFERSLVLITGDGEEQEMRLERWAVVRLWRVFNWAKYFKG